MKIAVIGPTLNTYYGIEEIVKYHDIKSLFTLPLELGLKKTRYTQFEDQANKYNFDIFYEEHNLKDLNVIKKFKDLNLDLIVELGSSKTIPPEVIESAKYGCIGSHGAKLPYIKGGASMNWALINGEKEWGVSIYYVNSMVDEGTLIGTIDFDIECRDDINTIHNKSDLITVKMLGNFLNNFKPKEEFNKKNLDTIKLEPSLKEDNWNNIIKWNNNIKEQYKNYKNKIYPQKSIFLPQRKPQDGFIDWNSSSQEIYNFIRSQIPPFPGAFTIYKGKKLFVYESCLKDDSINSKEPGKILDLIDNEGFIIKTLDSSLLIKKVKLEGMPEMLADDFYYEFKLELGDQFGI